MITVGDLMEARATLTAWCARCRRHQVLWRPGINRQLDERIELPQLQGLLRCGACSSDGELWISFLTPELLADKLRRLTEFNNAPYKD